MHEPSALHGLAVAAVEWLPSGAESGLIRIRGRWTEDAARQPDLPVLTLIAAGGEHRFDSLPDARSNRDPSTWRGTYLVPAELVASDPDAMWLEWPSGARSGLPALTRGVEPPPVPAAPERPEEPDEPGGQVIDRAVLAERRARRAEAAEQAQARVAAEALKAVEVLELRSTELERRLEEATTERDALGEQEAAGRREALAAALASAAALRSRAREWQLRMRTSEVTRAGDAVRLAVLESERASGGPAIRKALSERGAELEAARRELAAAIEAAAAARAEAEAADRRFADARAAWDRRREELETALAGARRKADEADALRPRVETLEAALAAAEGRLQTAEAALAATEARLRAESVARSTLEDELDRERAGGTLEADLEQERTALRATFDADLDRERRAMAESVDADRAALRASFEADRAAMRESFEADRASARASFDADHAAVRAAFEADHAAIRTALADAEQRVAAAEVALANAQQSVAAAPEQLVRLAGEQAAVAAAREPGGDASRLVADLDAAAEALRQSAPPVDDPPPAVTADDDPPAPEPDDDEPPAPDAEPAVEWADRVERERDPYVPGVEPVRAPGESEVIPWAPPGFESTGGEDPDEPPAPDAEPGVEWTPPDEPPPAAVAAVVVAPPPEVAAAPPEVVAAPPELQPEVAAEPEPEVVAEPEPEVVAEPEAKPGGPVIVSAPRPPARGLMTGTNRRDYPLLRGAIVKLAHDDPATAARLLAALLPAQGVAVTGPLAYDVTIKEAGTYGVAIAGGRASIEHLAAPQPRSIADFHLIGDAVTIAELLAGVNHRVGRFFGPIRARGRKRRLKELRPITAGTISLADAARAGARLDPELVYRTLAYAVHPSWTRGHDFTIAQEIEGETWYLTARDGAGVTAAATPPTEPDATVTMSRDVFDRLLRGESVPAGRRPCVKGDPEVVETMRAWTDRARGDVA